jgi:chloramphenicol 3-O-phosphotransferase
MKKASVSRVALVPTVVLLTSESVRYLLRRKSNKTRTTFTLGGVKDDFDCVITLLKEAISANLLPIEIQSRLNGVVKSEDAGIDVYTDDVTVYVGTMVSTCRRVDGYAIIMRIKDSVVAIPNIREDDELFRELFKPLRETAPKLECHQ